MGSPKAKSDPLGGLQHVLRCAFYEARRHSFGCEQGEQSDEEWDKHIAGCEKHLKLDGLSSPDGSYLPRVQYLTRLESMVAAGCRFQMNDLSPSTWRDLAVIARERQWMDEQVDSLRGRLREQESKIEAAQAAARKEANVPPPGQRIFNRGA